MTTHGLVVPSVEPPLGEDGVVAIFLATFRVGCEFDDGRLVAPSICKDPCSDAVGDAGLLY